MGLHCILTPALLNPGDAFTDGKALAAAYLKVTMSDNDGLCDGLPNLFEKLGDFIDKEPPVPGRTPALHPCAEGLKAVAALLSRLRSESESLRIVSEPLRLACLHDLTAVSRILDSGAKANAKFHFRFDI